MDRRQRKTRQAIFDAFEELVYEERYDRITVAQIIERADIGRSTFYAHFATKDELLDEMCEQMFAHVFDGVDANGHTHETTQSPTLEGTLAHLLCHLRDSYRGTCGKLLAEGEPRFTQQFCDRLAKVLAPRLPERSSWVPRDLMCSLVLSAFCEAVAWWYRGKYEAKPDDLAHWYLRTFGWPVQSR